MVDELRRLDEAEADGLSGSVFIAKRFELRNCRHSPSKIACECVADLVGKENPHHYIVAVQNYELRRQLREVVGVPLLFMNRGVVLMEEPSGVTKEAAHQKELDKLRPKAFELKALAAAKEKKPKDLEKKKKEKKGKKNPNPLSMKKPTKKPTTTVNTQPAEASVSKPKRKRRSKKKSE